MGSSAGVKLQFVPLTTALPSTAAPLRTRTVSPTARVLESVPLIVGVGSSVLPPAAMVPVVVPMSSVTAVMAAVVVGWVRSTANT